jgi:hypothetical protein
MLIWGAGLLAANRVETKTIARNMPLKTLPGKVDTNTLLGCIDSF